MLFAEESLRQHFVRRPSPNFELGGKGGEELSRPTERITSSEKIQNNNAQNHTATHLYQRVVCIDSRLRDSPSRSGRVMNAR